MAVANNKKIDDVAAEAAGVERRAAMAVLAQAEASEIERGLSHIDDGIEFTELRPAETGLVMLRGRIGGDGAPFNVGEATVTRAAVQLATGIIGFGYVLGRDGRKARATALCDALLQADGYRQRVEQHVLAPLRLAQQQNRVFVRAQTAATLVDFFTLVRGEDEA
jgi:alpha-D-ribose 1-methylphosphonate 5-triphosphate synthase subunit PhnG